jgi:[ribosomal protein S5]-alanine N-acetyltransferase
MAYLAQNVRTAIRHLSWHDHDELAALDHKHRDLHARWMPGPPITTRESFEEYLSRFERPENEGFLVCAVDGGAIVGRINVNNIVRGSHQSATVGYASYSPGQGHLGEGLRLLVAHAFGAMGLHRLEANIQPDNLASLRLARGAGFAKEGFSPRFQWIDGAWRDHERWAVTSETALPVR